MRKKFAFGVGLVAVVLPVLVLVTLFVPAPAPPLHEGMSYEEIEGLMKERGFKYDTSGYLNGNFDLYYKTYASAPGWNGRIQRMTVVFDHRKDSEGRLSRWESNSDTYGRPGWLAACSFWCGTGSDLVSG